MEKIKSSRALSFLILFFVYLFATIIGIVVYFSLPFAFAINLLFADIIATVFTFIFSLVFKNASVYDPYWSVQPIIIVFVSLFVHGLSLVTLFPLVAITFWGIRLTSNWAYTFKGLKFQDWRYTMLNETTGKFYPLINFIGIHMVPTLVVYFCVLPVVYLFNNVVSFNPFSIVFFSLSIFAVIIQMISDIEMQKFRDKKTHTLINVGLWKYSRHPNYLGEILMWWGIGLYSVISLSSAFNLLLGAVLNTLLFLFVSIPMADKRQSKKEGYEEYKKATRMLLPLPKINS